MMNRIAILVGGALGAASFCFAGTSQAIFAFSPSGSQQLILNGGDTVLDATNTGWYDQTGFSENAGNYIAGVCGSSDACVGDNLDANDYFVFDLSDVSGAITSAELSIGNPTSGYISPNPSETFNVWDVSTPISTLIASNTGQVGIYNDLGSGNLYGSTSVSLADDGNQVLVNLGAQALADIQAAEGNSFAVGGEVDPAGVPEPTSMLLLGAGLAALMTVGRRLRTN